MDEMKQTATQGDLLHLGRDLGGRIDKVAAMAVRTEANLAEFKREFTERIAGLPTRQEFQAGTETVLARIKDLYGSFEVWKDMWREHERRISVLEQGRAD